MDLTGLFSTENAPWMLHFSAVSLAPSTPSTNRRRFVTAEPDRVVVFAGFGEVFPMGTEVTSPPNQLAAFVEVGDWSRFWAILHLGF